MSEIEKKYPVTEEVREAMATIKRGVDTLLIEADLEQKLARSQATGTPLRCNAQMTAKMLREVCALTAEQGLILQRAMERLGLSARAYDRILKVSRTIADLAGTPAIETPHLLEAINYRSLDRNAAYF